MCFQCPLVPVPGRTSRPRLVTWCSTPTVWPGAQSRSRRTDRGQYTHVHNASCPAPEDTRTHLQAVSDATGQRALQSQSGRPLSQFSAITGAAGYASGHSQSLVPKYIWLVMVTSRCTLLFLRDGHLFQGALNLCLQSFQRKGWMLSVQPRRRKKWSCS